MPIACASAFLAFTCERSTSPQRDEVQSEGGLGVNCVFLGVGATGSGERGCGSRRENPIASALCACKAAGELKDLTCSISSGGGSKGSLCSNPVMNRVLVHFTENAPYLTKAGSEGNALLMERLLLLSSLRLMKMKIYIYFFLRGQKPSLSFI